MVTVSGRKQMGVPGHTNECGQPKQSSLLHHNLDVQDVDFTDDKN